MELLVSCLVILGVSVLVLTCSTTLGNEEKQKWGVRRHKTEYDYNLVMYKNSIFIDVR